MGEGEDPSSSAIPQHFSPEGQEEGKAVAGS